MEPWRAGQHRRGRDRDQETKWGQERARVGRRVAQLWATLGWAGLGWAGLGWAGLTGLGRAELEQERAQRQREGQGKTGKRGPGPM